MAEFSTFWTTVAAGAVGDQQLNSSGYTQAMMAAVQQIMADVGKFEGIAPNLLNKCNPAVTGANTVQVDTGSALVDGHTYNNSAAVAVNIPSAVGGGNTRIDRIVLRCSWAGYTIRIVRIPGTDAASPSIPAITQTPGTTYDIKICQVLVNTTGTCVVTDERVYAQIQTAGFADQAVITQKIADGAVTLQKLGTGSVDDTIAGNRIPKLTHRQGGHATRWNTAGTTNYVPTTERMQAGSVIITWNGVSNYTVGTVTFPIAFSDRPVVIATIFSMGSTVVPITVEASAASGATVDITIRPCDGSIPAAAAWASIQWIAVGPA